MDGAILHPDSVRTVQIGSTPNSSLRWSMYWQISGTGGRVECSVFLGPWFLVVSGCVFLASQLVFDLVGGAVAER